MANKLYTKLASVQQRTRSDLVLLLRPLVSEMPAPMHFQDDPFFPFSRAIIAATRDIVCGYLFDFPAYMAHGAAGAIALERSIAFAGPNTIKILHGAFVGVDYIPMIFEDALGADAATLAHEGDLAAYLKDTRHGAFIIKPGLPRNIDQPVYWEEEARLTIPGGDTFRIAGQSILYTGYREDFAQRCRAALEQMLP